MPVQKDRGMIGQKSVLPIKVTAHCFYHQNMMELVQIFVIEKLLVLWHSPPAEGLVEVKDTQEGIVWLPGNSLQNKEPLYWPIFALQLYNPLDV